MKSETIQLVVHLSRIKRARIIRDLEEKGEEKVSCKRFLLTFVKDSRWPLTKMYFHPIN